MLVQHSTLIARAHCVQIHHGSSVLFCEPSGLLDLVVHLPKSKEYKLSFESPEERCAITRRTPSRDPSPTPPDLCPVPPPLGILTPPAAPAPLPAAAAPLSFSHEGGPC